MINRKLTHDNHAIKYFNRLTALIKIHEISPGAIEKSNGLKVTCLMSLYFKSVEDTTKNLIFLRLYIIEEFYKLFNYFSHYTYHCMFFNYTIIIDRILDII